MRCLGLAVVRVIFYWVMDSGVFFFLYKIEDDLFYLVWKLEYVKRLMSLCTNRRFNIFLLFFQFKLFVTGILIT